jgi:tetratricopeptide (TPR) repeat protein
MIASFLPAARSAAQSLPPSPGSLSSAPSSPAGLSARDLVARAGDKRFAEDWYGAVEDYLQAVRINPSYSDALVGLAECYYELDEYDEALVYAKKASPFRKGDSALRNLEGFIRIGLADLPGAKALFTAVAAERPNDLDARFGLALLDLAAGKKTEARTRLEDSLRLSPQNGRALLSLALIAEDQGRPGDAASLIERALRFHGQEPRVQYTAARLARSSGDLPKAIACARNAIDMSPSYAEARRLLGALLFESGSYADAISLMQEGVARNRKDSSAWYTLGLVQAAAGKASDALYSYRQAVGLREDDEVARLALEELVMDTSPLESSARSSYAVWHFDRAGELEDRSFFDQAILEYRRGLEIDPNNKDGRVRYAELLRKRGLPARQLSELKFLADIGKADTPVNDAIETYDSLLQDSVSRTWGVDQYNLEKRPYRIALFYIAKGDEGAHAGGRNILLRYLKDLLLVSSRLRVLDLPAGLASSTEAFRKAREAEADYYLVLSIDETERDLRYSGELRVARTGSLATSFNSYRTGNERVKEATQRLATLLETSLQPEGSLLKRKDELGIVDLGSQDGIKVGDSLVVVKKASLEVAPDGLGPAYAPDAVVGSFTVTALDEELCEGRLKSSGFYDTINAGDSVVMALAVPPPKGQGPKAATPATTPLSEFSSLFAAVRRLR